jgi:histidinol-phosphate/aromatic aminotransferase/cobyric acid decarboxylase-like protein
VLRTFSKAYGLAACGSAMATCAGPGPQLRAMQPPFGISITSLVAVASYDAESRQRIG